MRTEVRIAGFGGQGVITVGRILGRAAVLHDARHAVLTEDYGPEKTGGWSRADLVVDTEEIRFPLVESPNVFVALAQDGYERFRKTIRHDALVLVESELVHPDTDWDHPPLALPARQIALELGARVVANIVMVGALVEATQIVSHAAARRAVLESVPKGKEALNEAAYERGAALAREAAR